MARIKKFLQKSTALLLAGILTLSFSSCAKTDSLQYESYTYSDDKTESSAPLTAEEAFNHFTNELFCDEICQDTLSLHLMTEDPAAFGINEYPVTLGEFGAAAVRANSQKCLDLRKQLKKFSYNELTREQQFTYDIVSNALELAAQGQDYLYYDEVLKPSIGFHAELPTVLTEFTFHTEHDITDYLGLLADLPRYFDQIISYEQEKADAGLFMSDDCADMVIADCQSFLEQKQHNILLLTFQDRINAMTDLDPDQKQRYAAQNEKLVAEDVTTAYENLISALQSLKGKGKNSGGLCNLPKGKDYYQYLLKCSVGTDRPAKKLEKLILNQVNHDLTDMLQISQSNPQMAQQTEHFEFTLTDPAAIIADLQDKINADFPPLISEVDLHIKYVNEYMEDSLSPAFYLTPPVDNVRDNVIYINNKSCDPSSLYSTLAHEGYPGHLYQTVYASTVSEDAPIRQLYSVSGYTEGWATYVENLSYLYDTKQNSDLLSIVQLNNSANLGIYALLDVYINYDGWTLEETGDWLKDLYADPAEDSIREIYYTIIAQPCNYLNYYVGYLEILSLREKAEQQLGDAFVLKEFHQFLLDMGEAPFYIIEKYMDDWLKTYHV